MHVCHLCFVHVVFGYGVNGDNSGKGFDACFCVTVDASHGYLPKCREVRRFDVQQRLSICIQLSSDET